MLDFAALLEQNVLGPLRQGRGHLVPGKSSRLEAEMQNYVEAYPYADHWHTHFEIFWLLSGQAEMKIEDQLYRLRSGDACLLAPHVRHADVYCDTTPAYTSVWFSYLGDMFSTSFFSYEPVGQWRVLAYRSVPCSPQVGNLFLALQGETVANLPHGTAAQQGLLLQLATWLLRALLAHPPGHSKSLPGTVSRRVLHYLQLHFAEDLSLARIAGAVHFSPTYLASLFKQETGQTIFEALTEIRLKHACELLLRGERPVARVAAAVGYPDPHHFSRTFRRHTGVSPSQYGR